MDVALDKFTLEPVAKLKDGELAWLNSNPRMGSIVTLAQYEQVQRFIQYNLVASSPLDYEIACWDLKHLSSLENSLIDDILRSKT